MPKLVVIGRRQGGARREDEVARRVRLAVPQIALVVVVRFLAHRDEENKCKRGDVCHKETYRKGNMSNRLGGVGMGAHLF